MREREGEGEGRREREEVRRMGGCWKGEEEKEREREKWMNHLSVLPSLWYNLQTFTPKKETHTSRQQL